INQSLCPFHNNQRRGANRYRIDVDEVWYHKNAIANNTPFTSTPEEGGYVHYPEKVEGRKIRARSKSFMDYYSQPRIFWNSMSPVEKQDRKSTRLNSSHVSISYAVFCLKKK